MKYYSNYLQKGRKVQKEINGSSESEPVTLALTQTW